MVTASTEATMRFPDASIHVRVVGEGPPLLLLSGLGAHTGMWGELERVFEDRTIVEFDLPGAGRSAVPWRPVSIKRLARLATAVLDRFGIEQPDVLGHSMGGVVAQQLAADAPDRVRRVVLLATTPGVGAVQGDLVALANILTPLRYLTRQTYTKTICSLCGGRARRDDAWVAEQARLRFDKAPSWRGYLGQLSTMATWSALPFLRRIEHPVLVVTGDDDPLTPVVNSMMMAHLLPHGRLLVFPGEGHLIPMDAESRAHPAIKEFLSAEQLDEAPVWRHAATVSAHELRVALARTRCQVPPLSIANAWMRRRWLPAGAAAPGDDAVIRG